MRAPKNLDQYTDVESAAKGLENFARDLRKGARPGDRVKWNLDVRYWNDDYLSPAKGRERQPIVVGEASGSLPSAAQ